MPLCLIPSLPPLFHPHSLSLFLSVWLPLSVCMMSLSFCLCISLSLSLCLSFFVCLAVSLSFFSLSSLSLQSFFFHLSPITSSYSSSAFLILNRSVSPLFHIFHPSHRTPYSSRHGSASLDHRSVPQIID